jgi:hypothetical protein
MSWNGLADAWLFAVMLVGAAILMPLQLRNRRSVDQTKRGPRFTTFVVLTLVAASLSCAGCNDAGAADGGGLDDVDGGVADAGTGVADAGAADAGVADAGVADGGVADGGIADGGVVDAGDTRTPCERAKDAMRAYVEANRECSSPAECRLVVHGTACAGLLMPFQWGYAVSSPPTQEENDLYYAIGASCTYMDCDHDGIGRCPFAADLDDPTEVACGVEGCDFNLPPGSCVVFDAGFVDRPDAGDGGTASDGGNDAGFDAGFDAGSGADDDGGTDAGA